MVHPVIVELAFGKPDMFLHIGVGSRAGHPGLFFFRRFCVSDGQAFLVESAGFALGVSLDGVCIGLPLFHRVIHIIGERLTPFGDLLVAFALCFAQHVVTLYGIGGVQCIQRPGPLDLHARPCAGYALQNGGDDGGLLCFCVSCVFCPIVVRPGGMEVEFRFAEIIGVF